MKDRPLDMIQKIMPVALIVFLALLFFGRTLIPIKEQIIYGGDLLSQFYYWKGYLADSIRSGIIPFWNPYNFSGTPFLAHPSTAFFYPLNFIFLLLPLNLAFSYSYFIHLLIAGIGMYYLTLKYADRYSSLISGCTFMLSGYFAARIYAGHVDLLTTAAWLPWVIRSGIEIMDDSSSMKSVLPMVLFLSLLILAGYSAYVVFVLLLLGLYCFYFLIRGRNKRFSKRKLSALSILGLSAIFAIMITAVEWLPTWELTGRSIRGGGFSYDLASWGSLPVSGLKLFLFPFEKTELNKITYNIGGGPVANPFDHFIGIIPLLVVTSFLLLKTLSIFFKNLRDKLKIRTDFWLYLFASIFFLWISFGRYAPINLHYFFFKIIPFYRYMRIPIQNLVIVAVLVPLMLGMILAKIKNKLLKTAVFMLILIELFAYGKKFVFLTDDPDKFFDKELISIIKEDKDYYRVLPDFRIEAKMPGVPDFNAWSKLNLLSANGYDPIILYDYYRFINLINKNRNTDSIIKLYQIEIPPLNFNSKLINQLGIKYIILGSNWFEQSENGNDLINIYNTAEFALYKNMSVFSPFRIVRNIINYKNERDMEEDLVAKQIDLQNSVLLLEKDFKQISLDFDKDCNEQLNDKIHILERKSNLIILNSQSECPGILTTGELNYPGWRAKVDGKPTKIFLSNIAFRSLYLPKGEHKVEFYYHPRIYYIGGAISLTSILIIAFIQFYLFKYQGKKSQ